MTELPKQDLLLKLLGMTTSASDNEALMAIRRANEFLARAGWTWEMLIREKIKIIENPFNGINDPTRRPKNEQQPTTPPKTTPPKPPTPPRPPQDTWHFDNGAATQQAQKPRPQMGPQNAGPLPRRSRSTKYRPSAGEL